MRADGMPLRVVAIGATTALIGIGSVMPAVAADSDIAVVNTETIQVYTSPTGEVDEQRIYEQLSFTGNGTVDVKNPVSVDGLRNLDGFGGFEVDGGNQIATVEVDGEERLRTVSDFNGDLPLTVSIEYYLDGERVEPSEIVGESGKLEVKYTVKNVTGVDQEVSFDDGKGGTVTKTVAVPIPMVGSLSTTVPSNFTDVKSDQANIAGDGRGATKMSFTMTLFPPIGSDTAEFGYTANISDGVVPPATISALPVNPLESPSFAAAGESYQGGADTGIELTDGASEIDANLLKLRDGAGELLAGLIKLRDGAQELESGLAGEASPGANLLADGADELNSGLGLINSGSLRLAEGTGEAAAGSVKLSDGAGRLADGAEKASAGSSRLADGASQLAAGLASAESKAPELLGGLRTLRAGLLLVDGGLKQMYTEIGTVPAKAQPLHDGIALLLNGIGSKAAPNTLLYGVDQVRQGLTAALPKIQAMADGVYSNSSSNPGAYQKLGCAVEVLTDLRDGTPPAASDPCYVSATNPTGVRQGLPAAFSPPSNPDPTTWSASNLQYVVLTNVVSGLVDGRSKLATVDGAVNETTLYGGLRTLLGSLSSLNPSSPGAVAALAAVECGLDNTALDGLTFNGVPLDLALCKTYPAGHPLAGQRKPGLKQGLMSLDGGIDQLTAGVVKAIRDAVGTAADVPEDQTLRGGMNGLVGGVDLIIEGGGTLLEGLGLLSDGAGELDTGAGALHEGLGVLAAGAGDLSDGTGTLEDGLNRLDDGANELAAGTSDAADGSGQLADGANQLADGLGDAADGSGQLAGGLEKAADGAPALEDGAQRLSDEGTSKLVEAGKSTAQTYGELYAVIEAGAERADSEKMAFGAPEGAMGLTAYTYEIRGDDGESGRNIARGLGGLALLAAGAGAFALRRRFI